ncbi:hypothetical protein HPB49_011486 [Dermacentor silvarum]|uniref:Uncharacterized protein n=1 Tax=Dermacentor silvarum TaxID=543639 RepID=A0ACB8DZ75_DERSI|nr:hypothetical protein HPB49_011486 [Dermacentor silvarum]
MEKANKRERAERHQAQTSNQGKLIIWQWNCRGFHKKKAILQQHIGHTTDKPDILIIQETNTDTPTLPVYEAIAVPLTKGCSGVASFVSNRLAWAETDRSKPNSKCDHLLIEVFPRGKKTKSILALNMYSSPNHKTQIFKRLLKRARDKAGDNSH